MPCNRQQYRVRYFVTLSVLVSFTMLQQVASFSMIPRATSSSFRQAAARRRPHGMVVSSFDLVSGNSHSKGNKSDKPLFVTAASLSSSSSASSSTTITNPLVLDPLVICGPSGVGKGSIIQRFQQDYPALAQNFGFTVSHTTRAPRPGEVNGVHYHFVTVSEMQNMLQQDAFLESAQVHKNYYGTSWQALRDVQQQGKRCLLDIDVQGVQRLKLLQDSWKTNSDASTSTSSSSVQSSFVLQPKYLFIAPPSLETLQERLRTRNTETPEALQTRLANAAAEVAYGSTLGNFDAIVVNDDLEEAVRDFSDKVRQLYHL